MQFVLFLRGLMSALPWLPRSDRSGVLCIKRALANGRQAALMPAWGAALADTFFGAVAGLA